MLVPEKLALFVTVRLAAAALVIAPVELSTRLLAVLVPESCVEESSAMLTVPGELKVSEKFDSAHKFTFTKEVAVNGQMTLLGSSAPTEFVGGSGHASVRGECQFVKRTRSWSPLETRLSIFIGHN